MAAPAFGAAGTYLTGSSAATANVAVPAGVTAGQVILVVLFKENAATVTTIPSGFTEAPDSPVVNSGTHLHNLHVFWKRATGADAGTYNFAWTGSVWREASAMRYTGCISSGTPFDVTNSAVKTATTGATSPAVSDTTTVNETLLVWAATNWQGGAWTPPTAGGTWTERVDANSDIGVATKEQAVAGATGSITGACTNDAGMAAWLGALLPVSSAATANPQPIRRVLTAVNRSANF